jgi:DNA-binding IclR family transcriptional regulator
MNFDKLNRLQFLDHLIKHQRTGNAQELAEKLHIKRRQVYNLLNELKDIGLEIEYNRQKRSFIYPRSIQFTITLGVRNI